MSLTEGKNSVSRVFDTLDMGPWENVTMKRPTSGCKLLGLHGCEPRQIPLQQWAPSLHSNTSGF